MADEEVKEGQEEGATPEGQVEGATPEEQNEEIIELIDYSDEEPVKPNQSLSLQAGDKYDPRPKEDEARRNIAYSLIGLLWLIVAGILILLAFGGIKVEDIKDFGVVLSPMIALVSAATGFYYGKNNT